MGERFIGTGDALRSERYEILRLIRVTAGKQIYLAHDRVLDRKVVVDVFSRQLVMPNGMTVASWEAQVLAKLDDHPNIATVQDYWEDDKEAFLISRYLCGGNLRQRIIQSRRYGGLSAESLVNFSTQIARALAHIHSRGILYLDLQPCNVLLDEWDTVHLVDFDTAVRLGDRVVSDLREREQVGYIAPELAAGRTADERADLYSLGATIHEMASGYPAFSGSREEILAARQAAAPPPIVRNDLPEQVPDLISGLLATDPGERPASAAEVVGLLADVRLPRNGKVTGARWFPDDSHPLPEPDPAEVKASATASAAVYAAGDVIEDRFEVLDELGEGGYSKVYLVRDTVEDEERALKLFHNAGAYEAVRRELAALRKVRHPNVVEVFWAGKTGAGDWYLITEFVDGECLADVAAGNKRLRDREAIDVVLDILQALVAFHPDAARLAQLEVRNRAEGLSEAEFAEWMDLKDNGLVHRDIKPQNVMLTRGGAKLLDFNIASRVGDPVLTQSGTPPYRPPDADLTRWDVSTDLFAVGVMLYELLCDHHPYPNATPMVEEPVTDPRDTRPDLDTDLASFLTKACSPTRGSRFPTATEMERALREIRASL